MVFLNGALLAFMGALGLPVLVHLLTLRRRRARGIPTLRFLKEIENTRLKRVRLTRWLLLLVRLLLLAALVLAFARPVLTGASAWLPGGREPVSLLLLLDDSASSRLPAEEGHSVWELARERALERLGGLEARDRVWLLPLSEPSRLQGPLTPTAAGQRLAKWIPTWGGARLDECLEAGLAALERDGSARRQVLLLSDLRLETPRLPADSLPRAVSLWLTRLPSPSKGAAPREVELRTGILREDRPVGLSLGLEGGEALADLSLSLAVEGETRLTRALSPQTSGPWRAREELDFRLPETGWLRGSLRLEGDAVELDNELCFVLHVPARRRVLLLAGDPELERVLAAALLPDERYRRGLELLRGSGTSLAGLDPSAVDQVVLALGQPLGVADLRRLREMSARGARFLLLPASHAELQVADRQARELGLPGVAALREAGQLPWRMDGLDRRHEIPASILEEEGALEPVAVRRLLELQAQDPPGLARRTLAQAGGRPLLQSLESEAGRALWLSTVPLPAWSGLGASGLLAPILQQGLRWLDGDDRLPPLQVCGEPGRWTPPREARGRDWTLVRGDARWRLKLDPRKGWLELPALPEPGHYEVLVDGRPAGWLAARAPVGETTRPVGDPARWNEPAAGGWRELKARDARNGGENPAELTPWLLLAVLALLGWESWLARGRGGT